MATINLLPSTVYLTAARRRRNTLFLLSGVTIALVGLVWIALIVWKTAQQRQEQELERSIRTVETEITKLKPVADRIILFEGRLTALDRLLTERTSLDPLLREIERLLPPPTVLQSATLNINEGTLRLTGTTPSLDDVAQTLASLGSGPDHATLFSRAEMEAANRREQVVSGQVVSAAYTFNAALFFDASKLKSTSPL